MASECPVEAGCLKKGKGDSVILQVHVQPRSSKNVFSGIHGDAIKLRITSPPVDGKANEQCRTIIAKLFKVSKSSVDIISGKLSREKTFEVNGVKVEDARLILIGVLP